MMSIFDLLFILVFLATVAVLAAALIALLLRRGRAAGRLLAGWAAFILLYLGAVAAVSLASPQRVVAMGEKRCFDDWCVAVEDVVRVSELGAGEQSVTANGVFYVVTLQLSNRARGRAQRASSAAIHLLDGQGRVFDLSALGQAAYEAQHGAAAPLTTSMPVGGSFTTVQVFDLPLDAREVGLTVEHPVGFSPGWFIIGDESSLLHKPTIVPLN
jgi:hypothetical protein